MGFVLLGLILLALIVLSRSLRIVPQKQALIIERLGKFHNAAEAGLNIIMPFFDSVRAQIDLREQITQIEPQPVITRDNVTMEVDAVIYYVILDPVKSTYEVSNLRWGLEQLTLSALRNVIGGLDLDHTLTSRDMINSQIRAALDASTGPWGVKIMRVELKNINPPEEIKLTMEKQMTAERTRRAVVTTAEGEKAAAILRAEGQKQAAWRTDPARSGAAGCMGDIGSHAENLVDYVTGLRIEALCADLSSFVPGRRLDDDGTLAEIRRLHAASGYLADPHSAIGIAAARALPSGGSGAHGVPTIAMATAHPAKFPDAVQKAIGERPALPARLSDLLDRTERVEGLANDTEALKALIDDRMSAQRQPRTARR